MILRSIKFKQRLSWIHLDNFDAFKTKTASDTDVGGTTSRPYNFVDIFRNDINKKNVKDMRDYLKKRGLGKKGKREELLDRFQKAVDYKVVIED